MFVELTPEVLVDPAEVAAVTNETATTSRIYMRGSGASQHLLVDLNVAEVVAALASRPDAVAARARRVREELRPAAPARRPTGGRA